MGLLDDSALWGGFSKEESQCSATESFNRARFRPVSQGDNGFADLSVAIDTGWDDGTAGSWVGAVPIGVDSTTGADCTENAWVAATAVRDETHALPGHSPPPEAK